MNNQLKTVGSTMKMTLGGALLVLMACQAGSGVQQQHQGVDQTQACPEGQVGWDFGTEPFDPSSAQAEAQAGDASVACFDGGCVSAYHALTLTAIDVQSAKCTDGTTVTDESIAARSACSGSRSCSYTPTCTGTFELVYECGSGDRGPDGGSNGYSVSVAAGASNRKVTFQCNAIQEDGGQVPSRKACVPKLCRGKTRRDSNLACVPDTTMTEVPAGNVSVRNLTFTQVYDTVTVLDGGAQPSPYLEQQYAGAPIKQVLYGNAVYDVTGSVEYFGQFPPPEARMSVWFTDTFTYQGSSATVFRCVAATYDIGARQAGTNARVININKRMVLSRSCFDSTPLTGYSRTTELQKEAFTRMGATWSEYEALFAQWSGTEMHISYDIDGKTLFIPTGHTSASACGPNPVDFFYDSTTRTMDMVGYYKQRELTQIYSSPAQVYQFTKASRVEVGINSAEPREPSVTIPLYSPIPTTIPVDIDWYDANDTGENLYSVSGPIVDAVKNSDGTPYIGAGWDARYQLISSSLAPQNLRMRVYIVPKTFTPGISVGTDYPILGEIPLSGASPTGAVLSADFRMSTALKTMFFKENTLLTVAKTDANRSYYLLTCMVSDRPDFFFEPRFYKNGAKLKYDFTVSTGPARGVDPRFGVPPSDSISLGNAAEAAKAFSPYSNIKPGRGCRFSKTPLIVSLDRTVRSLSPISNNGWGGMVSDPESGNSTMTQQMDNDGQRTCTGNTCNSASGSGLRGQGEFARQYYKTNTDGDVDEGQDLSGDGDVETLGFQVVSPAEPESTQPWPMAIGGQTPAVTITITPPWDALWSYLHNAARGSPIEWERGRYAGIMGLGVGWGFKIPVQMGPIPGLITITVSAGIGIALKLEWNVAPTAEEKYPCLNTSNRCFSVSDNAMTLDAAAKDCTKQGGRLAELSSQAEAGLVDTTARANPDDNFWVGGQVGYRYGTAECGASFNASSCTANTVTSYRWLSNDKEFATATGSGAPTYTPEFFGVASSSLSSPMPSRAGLVYAKNGTIRSGTTGESHKAICVFDPATKDAFHKLTATLEIGAAIGIGISFCVPNDEVGFCLEGTLNLAGLGIKPQVSYTMHKLTNAQNKKSTRSNTNVNVEWSLTLLEGEIKAKIAAFGLFEVSWTIVQFDGFKVAGGKLFDYDAPSIEEFK